MSEITYNPGTAYDDYTPGQRVEFLAAFNKDLPRTTDEWLDFLSRLSRVEYDLKRNAVAERLGIRLPSLDAEVEKRRSNHTDDKSVSGGRSILLYDSELWPSVVDGAELLHALLGLIKRYVILPAGAAVAIVLWVLHTYLLDAAEASPILAITS